MNEQKTILVVDDEDAMRVTLRSALESYGFAVLDAENGAEAFRIAQASPPDLVLCDIEMPEINGFELLTMFREHDPTSTVPFVFLTGRSDRSYVRKGMNLGADDFITKPATAAEVYSAVSSRLKRREEQEGKAEERLGELREHITRSVPHELRTPLTGIIGFVQILQEQGQDIPPEEFNDIAGQIMLSAEQLQTTLEKFWFYSQVVLLARNRKEVEDLRLHTLRKTRSLLESLSSRKAAHHGRESDLQMQIMDGCINISEVHLSKIAGEILENAFKFSDAGASVEIAGEPLKDKGIYELSVSDRGRGMAQDQIDGIGAFIQFEREKHEQQGLGLGLSIAKEITVLYRGEFNVESSPGKGTTVSVRLPLCA